MLTFFTQTRLIAAGALLAAVVVLFIYISSLHGTIEAKSKEIEAKEQFIAQISNQLEQQNAAVLTLKAESDKQQEALKTARATARNQARKSAARIEQLRGQATPLTCEASIDFLKRHAIGGGND